MIRLPIIMAFIVLVVGCSQLSESEIQQTVTSAVRSTQVISGQALTATPFAASQIATGVAQTVEADVINEAVHATVAARLVPSNTTGEPPPTSDLSATDLQSQDPGILQSPNSDLVDLALELINKDRADHGIAPVRLGDNEAAQVHADEMLEHRYLGHWTLGGLKPYMLYTLAGGTGAMAENAAYSGWTFEEWKESDCDSSFVNCDRVDSKEEIKNLQHLMVYEDADSDWGHRDTILDPVFDTVNIGIAINNQYISLVLHFETQKVSAISGPEIVGSLFSLTVDLGDSSIEIGEIVSIEYDPPQRPNR